MLYVYFGRIEYETAPIEMVASIDDWFDTYFSDEWMRGEWAKKVVENIDESKVIDGKTIESPVLGTIPVTWLSGGSKNLIMMNAVEGIGIYVINDGSTVSSLEDFIDKHLDFCSTKYVNFDQVNWPIKIVSGTLAKPEIDF